jgi:prolyl 4-hydroxylase
MEYEYIDEWRIFAIKNFLSPAECEQHIQRSEALGFAEAPITTNIGFVLNKDVRDNDRVMLDDVALATDLWQRAALFIPTPLYGWDACGFNERFRYYRYTRGQKFLPHYDGSFVRCANERSLLTFLIYLNDGYRGGETKLDTDKRYLIQPEQGKALVFFHKQLHEGAPIQEGVKYILRTDVMYHKPLEIPPSTK